MQLEPLVVANNNTSMGGAQSCPGLANMTDPRDGQINPTVQMGSQGWLKKYMNIGDIVDCRNDQNPLLLQKWFYNDNSRECDIYSGLYQLDEVMQGSLQIGVQGICPPDWHVTTDREFGTLTD
jgi:uncharacterized protein (TIGR02145 family)